MIYKIKPWILNWSCFKCGAQVPDAYNICPHCGAGKS